MFASSVFQPRYRLYKVDSLFFCRDSNAADRCDPQLVDYAVNGVLLDNFGVLTNRSSGLAGCRTLAVNAAWAAAVGWVRMAERVWGLRSITPSVTQQRRIPGRVGLRGPRPGMARRWWTANPIYRTLKSDSRARPARSFRGLRRVRRASAPASPRARPRAVRHGPGHPTDCATGAGPPSGHRVRLRCHRTGWSPRTW